MGIYDCLEERDNFIIFALKDALNEVSGKIQLILLIQKYSTAGISNRNYKYTWLRNRQYLREPAISLH